MPPVMFFSLLFLLASAADGRSLTGCLFSDGQLYPPGEFSPARCTRCTCMTTQLSAGRYKYLPICVNTCKPDGPVTTVPTTIPTSTPTTTVGPRSHTRTGTVTTETTTAPTTTGWLPCWLRPLKFTCQHKPCVDATPDDYSNCRCGHCPNGPNCYAWDGSIISAGGAVEVDGAICQCPNYFSGWSLSADCDFGALTG